MRSGIPVEFSGLFLGDAEGDRLLPVKLATARLLEVRPDALALLIEFELLADLDGVARLRTEWNLLHARGRRTAPELAFTDRAAWADCWAIQRFPWVEFGVELLSRELLAETGQRARLDPLQETLGRAGILLWPEAVLLATDTTSFLTGAAVPSGTLRPLVSQRDRENYTMAADLFGRLTRLFPGLASPDPDGG